MNTFLKTILYSFDFRPGFAWNLSNCAVITLHVNHIGEISLVECDGVEYSKDIS